MKKELTLVILAAGMGSRFGGLKQIEPFGPSGEFIIDYSIYDAKASGFTKVVFVIKEENYEVFKNTIGKRVEDKIEVCYAFQDLKDIPKKYILPSDRTKPLGTAHAIYAARKYINGNFAIINADDFYGRDSFQVLANFLKEDFDTPVKNYAMVGYKAANTMTLNGSVKRGVAKDHNGYLESLTESKLYYLNDEIIAEPLNGEESFKISKDTKVSMNMFGFTKDILKYIEDGFDEFFSKNKDNLLTCEYLIPDVVFKSIKDKVATVKVLETNSKWYGVTYKSDKESVVEAISNMIKNNEYPSDLWK